MKSVTAVPGASRLPRVPALLALVAAAAQAASPEPPALHTFHHGNVLGTSLELRVLSEAPEAARSAEATALAEIDRLARILSGYTPNSEFSRWLATKDSPVAVSSELLAVLGLADHWRVRTAGAFQPGVEAFTRRWKAAEHDGIVPSVGELQPISHEVARPAWRLDPAAGTATRLGTTPQSLNAIAKGWIIEQASARAAATPAVEGLLLEIGGDLRVRGRFRASVAVADPGADAENAKPLQVVEITNAALATSGGYRRGFDIGGRHFSHIIDPRTGQPMEHVPGVSVIAPDAATADALSTAFSVMDSDEALRLAESLPDVGCLLVLRDGRRVASARWPAAARWTESPIQREPPPPSGGTNAAPELSVAFEINRPEGGRYARPYVAIWIEDGDAFPVRTVLLWVLQSQKGERWIPDLRRWYRGEQTRRLADDRDMVATVSAATRNPGRYSVVWDGKDDAGKAVKPGKYTLYIEAAREHGTYQLMKHEFEVGGKPFTVQLKGNEEIKGASLEYRLQSSRK